MGQCRMPVVAGPSRRARLERVRTHRRRKVLGTETLEPRHLLAADVIISEIMYHAESGDPGEDWIELFNRGDDALDLNGHQLTAGVDYTFPQFTLEAGGYLVVAADVDKFSALYPTVSDVVGGWNGKLSNSGENIRLVDDQGLELDETFYADSGDFAIRRLMPIPTDIVNFVGACGGAATLNGWRWIAPHDGEGASLELINTDFTNDLAHNWTASTVNGGTPGTANSVDAVNIAPSVSNVVHAPIIPTSADTVLVTAHVMDDQMGQVAASLFYREDGGEVETFVEAPMFDDGLHEDGRAGDGVFTATIPPHDHNAIIEFYIVAQDDGGLTRFYPAPSDDLGGQETNLLYQVDDEERPADLPLYRTIMTTAERDYYQLRDHRCSDAQRNATLIWSYGGRTEIRYNVGVRYRGSDSRPLNPPSQRFNIPSDRALLGNTQFNIGGQSPDDQIAGSALWALANEPAADAWAVRVFQNGNDLNPSGYFAQVEVLNNDWAQRHFPLDGNGNGYRGRRANEGPPGGQGAGLQYFGENQGPYSSYLKQTNRGEQDWSDIVRLTDALNNAPNETYLDEVGQFMNIDQWLRSIAVTEVTGYSEFGLLTGDPRGDDWAMYRGIDDPRFVFVPYDLDTMFTGRTGDIFSAEAVPALARLINYPGIMPQLYGHFIDLIDNVFVEDRVRPHLEQLFDSIEPEATINSMISFLEGRGDFIKNSLALALTVQATDPVFGDFPRTTADTAGAIRGESNVVHTRRVTVAGEEASWNPRTGAWSITGIPLQPGVNRLPVQAVDESGEVFETAWIEIFRDTGSTNDVSGGISEDTTWTIADGPYRVTSQLTIAPEATLTIEPGTSVFFEPGTQMVINGQLNAVGTEDRQIRFTRTPGTAATWGGLQFANSMADNRIHWAVVEWGVTNNGLIGLDNSNIELDSVTLDHTDRRRIRTIDSSLVVRNSTFTNIFDPGEAPTTNNQSEHIWGSGIPDDGQFRLENNFFGHITGHNDGVDFDAPRLPNPIPHILGNVFAGGGDDALDLTGDVHIEGNTFRNYIKDQFNDDPGESNTISSSGGDFYVLRNVFENIQHAALVKEGAFMHFLHNTVVNAQTSALYFDLPGQTSGPGRGATVVGNVFDNTTLAVDLTNPPTGELTVSNSLLPESELAVWPDNLSGQALLIDVAAGDFRLRDGSTAQGSGPNGLDMGATVPAGASIAGEPVAVTRRTDATLTVGGPGITHYRYRLNDGPFSPETPVETPIELTGLADGSYTIYVIGKDLLGNWQQESAATESLSWTVDSSVSRLVINEVLVSNDTAVNYQETYPDMIELFNDGPVAVSLEGLSLTDDVTRPTRFVFPNGSSIGPGEYMTLFADDPNGTDGFHLGFNLSREGEGVFLFDSIANGSELIDSVEFGTQVTNLSIGRDRDDNWTLTQPTLGSVNQTATLGDPSLLRINEWMTTSDVVVSNDYLELFNPNPAPVRLGGLFLTDNASGWPTRHEIAPLSYIGGDGLALFIADGDPQDGPDHVDFRMSAEMEVIGLADGNGSLIDFVRYTPQIVDVSEGRTPNGALDITRFPLPNPNLDNPGEIDIKQQLLFDHLRITELNYNPLGGSDFEFIEFQNTGATSINLAGVRLSEGVDFTFPDVTLGPGEHIVVGNDIGEFRNRYGTAIPFAGEFQGNLSNGGERLRLQLPAPNEINILDFLYEDDWHPGTDGSGFSLVIVDPMGARNSWSQRVSWRPSNFLNGSPGITDAGFDTDILVINEVLANTDLPEGGKIELLNTTAGLLNIGGWYLSDNRSALTKYRIPAGTEILPSGYVSWNEQDDFGGALTLAEHGGELFLASPDAVGDLAGFITTFTYGAVDAEASVGRYTNSDDRVEIVEQASNSFGSENSGPRVGPIVINEIHYRPLGDAEEYIELRNISGFAESLFDPANPANTYHLMGDVELEFPTGVEIPAGGLALVVAIDPNIFRTKHGIPAEVPILGPYAGTLSDDGADIRLVRPGVPAEDFVPQILVEHVDYDDAAPWPELPATINVSLNRLRSAEYANDAINWGISIVDGTPGAVNANVDVTPPTTPSDVVSTLLAGPQVDLSWTAATDNETDIAIYRIFRDTIQIGTSTVNNFVDVNATAPGSFSYAVSAINRQGLESNRSDTSHIQILGVESLRTSLPTEILLRFSEPVTEASANVSNFVIEGITIEAAERTVDGRTVKLTTSTLTEGVDYELAISNVSSQSIGQLPPGLTMHFQYIPGVPGFTVRGVQSTGRIGNLNQADLLLSLPSDDPGIEREQTGNFATINFLDDDGRTPQGMFGEPSLFPSDSPGDDDDLAIQARGLLTIPSGQSGDWTFGANVALPETGTEIALLPFGSTWRYLNDGSDQGTAWIEPEYDDAAWSSGAAELGYGDGDEATVVGFSGDPTSRPTTTYFRNTFHVSDPSSLVIVVFGRVIRDDGVAIFVNGKQVERNNLAADAAFNDFAETAISGGEEDEPVTFTLFRSDLVAGDNLIAVEIHQAESDSSDMSFDLELSGLLAGTNISDDGFRLRIDGSDALLADSQHTESERLRSVSLDEGVHEIEFVFFERGGGAEVELFAAPGAFTSFDETDAWRLVGDVSGGGLAVKTDPPPPTPLEWTRANPLGSLTYEFADTVSITEGGLAFQTDFLAGQVLSIAADPLGASLIDVEVSGDDGILAAVTSATSGEVAALNRYVIPTSGAYVVRFEVDNETDANLLIALDASLEDEYYLDGPANDTPLTATDLNPGLSEISADIRRSVVHGVTDGFQQSRSEMGTLFAPNVLSFDFDNLPATLDAAQLLIRAQGDLDGNSEFLTIDAEGLFQQDIFVEGGVNSGSSATLDLTAEQITDLAADGVITITVTPSAGVNDQGANQIELILQVGEAPNDHYQVSLTDGEPVAVVLSSLTGGDVNLDLVDETGALVVGGIQVSGADRGEVIRNFLTPGDGTYYFRVSGERQRPYRLMVVTGAEVDLGVNDTIETAGDITFYGAAIGGLGGAGGGDVGGGGNVTPITLPIDLFDGTGFRWDIQGDGSIGDGTSDAYDGGLFHQNFGFLVDGFAEDNGREVIVGPTSVGANIEVTRKIYVPVDEGFARFLEIVTNTGTTTANYAVNLFTNLGSDVGTALVGTSSGDAFFTAEDNWIVTDDQDGANDPSMTHVIAGNGLVRPSLASSNGDNINFTYQLQLTPGETQIIAHFAAQHNNRAEALAKAVALESLELGALESMSPLELSQLVNFSSEDTVDHFALRVSAGDSLSLSTETPSPEVVGLVNDLDPIIELLDPDGQVVAMDDNSAADGRNAALSFDAVVDGKYTVRVTAVHGSGEYVLRASGNSIVALPLTVVSTEPVEGARLKDVPAAFRVNFAAPFDATTLDPADITINDQPAIGLEVVDGDSVDFLLDPVLLGAGGDFTVEIREDVISGLAGGSNESFQSTFFVDAVAPRVASTSWNGLPLPDDRTLPSGNLIFTFTFDEALDPTFLDENDLSIFDTTTFETLPALGIFYDDTSNTLSASFGSLGEGEYTLVLAARDEAFEDTVGNNLDGEPNGVNADGTPTGDGVEGGDYAVTFIVDNPPQALDNSMTRVAPFGALVYQAEFNEAVSYNADFEKYSLALGAGELLDISVVPSSSIAAMTLRVVDEESSHVVQEITGDVGQPIHLSTLRVATSGRYLVETTGDGVGIEYAVHIVRNGGLELSDTTATDPFLLGDTRLDFGAERWAAIGRANLIDPEVLVWGVQPASGQILVLDPANGTVVNQFAAPDALAAEHTRIGLAMAGLGSTLLYLNADVDPTRIYRLDPNTGAVLGEETVASGDYDGLGFVEGNLFLSNRNVDVRRQPGLSAPVTDGWATGAPTGAIGGDNFGRVFGFFSDGMIHEFDPDTDTNSFVSTIAAPSADIEGLAFDSEFLYASTAAGQLYTIDVDPDTAESVVGMVPVPGGALWGLAAHTTKGLATGRVVEVEPNNGIGEAQPIDAEFLFEFNPNIHDTVQNTSETIPHVTVEGTGDGTFDYYSFFATAGARAIFDIDTTDNLDSFLRLYDANGFILSENDDTFFGGDDPGSDTGLDSFLEFTFPSTGQFFIEVGSCCVSEVPDGGTYQLHVSVENHPTGASLIETVDELVETGSDWRFLDDGSDQGTEWQAPGFDDADWSEGPAQLGYGDGDEATLVNFGPDANNKFVTTYFRREFEVTNPTSYATLTLALQRDDGAAVYLNGAEVVRDNLPAGATFDTLALSTINGAAESVINQFAIDLSFLVSGTNVLAVEIHQADADSSDISFDLQLTARSSTEPAPLPPIPDVDFYQLDVTDTTLGPFDIVLASVEGGEDPIVALELIGPDGTTVVATGSPEPTPGTTSQNLDLGILGFSADEVGIYSVRVTSSTDLQYDLLVTRNALVEIEPNDETNEVIRSLDDVSGAFGFLSSGGGTTTADDPEGDTISGTGPAPDIAAVSASVEGDILALRMDLHNTISPNAPWFAYFELDLDQNRNTGDPALQNIIGPAGQQGGPLGVERRVIVGTQIATGGFAIIIDNTGMPIGQFPLTIGADFFLAQIPLSELNNDDGNINIGTISGVIEDQFVRDAAPDTSFLSVNAGGGGVDAAGDLYQITLSAGEVLKLATQTPLDGPDDSVNQLDPAIELLDPLGAVVAEDTNSGADGKNAELNYTATEAGVYTIRVFSDENGGEYFLFVVPPDGGEETQVIGRSIFYNNSAFDGNDPTANSGDDAAIAPDKTALLPGQTATFANYTSYARGINGIMIDVEGLAGTPTVEDFEFRAGNDDQVETWLTAPAPTSVTIRSGAGEGGSSRIVLIWDDNAIDRQWLQVTVRATERTGLTQPDVFYFANAIGESGNSDTDAKVNASDEIAARNNSHTFVDPAPIDDAFDYNRDQRVNATDEIIARNNATTFVNELQMITPPSVVTLVEGDFNGDGQLSLADIDLLTMATAAGSNDLAFDLNEDGVVSYGDIFMWVVDLFGSHPGDANLDGVVDGEDLAIWNDHRFLPSDRWSEADFNGDGVVDGHDFNLWNEYRFVDPAEPARALLNAPPREPRAALNTDLADRLPRMQQPTALADAAGRHNVAVRQQQLNPDLPANRFLNNMFWASWPAANRPAVEDQPERPDLSQNLAKNSIRQESKWISHIDRLSAGQGAASQWQGTEVETNALIVDLRTLDAFFARRETVDNK